MHRGKDAFSNVWKMRIINWASSSQATSLKLGEYNPLPTILMLRFSQESYLLSNSHTNNVYVFRAGINMNRSEI